jgi:hypothetical protein
VKELEYDIFMKRFGRRKNKNVSDGETELFEE